MIKWRKEDSYSHHQEHAAETNPYKLSAMALENFSLELLIQFM
ncbi:MAG: hypothetical protein QXW80_00365 [Candidatus Micrarchaeia archaeon]